MCNTNYQYLQYYHGTGKRLTAEKNSSVLDTDHTIRLRVPGFPGKKREVVPKSVWLKYGIIMFHTKTVIKQTLRTVCETVTKMRDYTSPNKYILHYPQYLHELYISS